MRFLLAFSLLAISSSCLADSCALSPSRPLTAEWMRISGRFQLDFVGADLVQSENLNRQGKEIAFGILESCHIGTANLPKQKISQKGIKNNCASDGPDELRLQHATAVAEILLNEDAGLSPNGRLVAAADSNYTFIPGKEPDSNFFPDFSEGSLTKSKCDLSSAVRLLNESGAKIVNNSGILGSWKPTEHQLKSLKPILVTSAGNSPPDIPLSPYKARDYLIAVGTLQSDGTRGGNGGEALAILGPAVTPTPVYTGMGMTSGAAPTVTSSLIIAMSFLPSLDVQTAKQLLKQTATQNSTGVGYLNAYRMARVSKRIEERLSKKRVSATPDAIRSQLNESSLMDFTKEAREAFETAEKNSRQSDCESKKSAEQLYRKAFLLTGDETYRTRLVQYLTEQAAALPSVDKNEQLRAVAFIKTLRSNGERSSAHRPNSIRAGFSK